MGRADHQNDGPRQSGEGGIPLGQAAHPGWWEVTDGLRQAADQPSLVTPTLPGRHDWDLFLVDGPSAKRDRNGRARQDYEVIVTIGSCFYSEWSTVGYFQSFPFGAQGMGQWVYCSALSS